MDSYEAFDDELFEVFGERMDILKKLDETTDSNIEKCEHSSSFEDSGTFICKDCGCEVEYLDFQPEWRFYGAADNRISKDPSRCHRAKESTRGGIDKVFVDCKLNDLPFSIKKLAEQKYKEVVGEETVRGRGRKAIVAACVLYTYREDGDIRTSDEVRLMFGLSKQEMSMGLTRYHTRFPEARTYSAKPCDLIRRMMIRVGIGMSHYKNIRFIAKCLENVDVTLNRSTPQAVASAVIYLYLCLSPELRESINFSKSKFATDVELSDITISKLVKRAATILKTNIDI